MKETAKIKKEIIFDIENREYIANKHVMRCFTIAMCVYLIAFLLNAFDIFIIDKTTYGNSDCLKLLFISDFIKEIL